MRSCTRVGSSRGTHSGNVAAATRCRVVVTAAPSAAGRRAAARWMRRTRCTFDQNSVNGQGDEPLSWPQQTAVRQKCVTLALLCDCRALTEGVWRGCCSPSLTGGPRAASAPHAAAVPAVLEQMWFPLLAVPAFAAEGCLGSPTPSLAILPPEYNPPRNKITRKRL